MSNLICPFCQQEYIITKDDSCFGQQRCVCRNPNCEFDGWHFPIKLVSELIRTRKALAFAKSKLNGIHRLYSKAFYTREDWLQVCMEMVDKANTALEQINKKEQQCS